MQLFEIKSFLDRGDYVKIARQVGHYDDEKKGRTYVYHVLSGKKPSRGFLAKSIIKAAKEIAIQNKAQGKIPTK